MKTHVQVIAILHIVLGIFSLLAAFFLFAVLGVAGSFMAAQGEHQAGGVLGVLAFALGGLLAVLALPGIIGGWGLYLGRPWARPLVIVLAILHIFNFPFGTGIGIYTIWALLYQPQPGALQA